MRLYFILLLVAVTLVSSVDAGSKFLAGDQVDSVTKRFLRAEAAVDKGDSIDSGEERGFVLPGFAQKIKTLAKSSVQNVKVKLTDFRVEMKFLALDLHSLGGLSSPGMKKWADSVAKIYKYDTETSAKTMLHTLTKYYDDVDVTRWAQAAKGSAQMGDYAYNVQFVQFAKWMEAGLDGPALAKTLQRSSIRSDTWRDKAIVEAFDAFIKTQKAT